MAINRNLLPSWTKNFRIVNGQDHLSLQSISINLYGKLLPGMTNLTQRIRYYSIYPWILSNYVQRVGNNNRKQWRDFLRRAEFLYALVGSSNKEEFSIPGSQTAKEVLKKANGKINFSKYAEYNSSESYWKHSFGAYGQYFLGTLRHLDIIYTEDNTQIDFLGENGKELETIMAHQIPKDITELFFKCVTKGSVSIVELTTLCKSLSPSKIHPDSKEAKKLREILFEQNLEQVDTNRIETLKMILSLIEQFPRKEDFDQDDIKYTILYGRFINGKIFKNDKYTRIASLWRAFMIGELTHYTMEVFFRLMLEKIYEYDGIEIDKLLQDLVEDFYECKKYSKYFTKSSIKQNSFVEFTKNLSLAYPFSNDKWGEDNNSLYSISIRLWSHIRKQEYDEAFFCAFLMFSKLIHTYKDDKDLINLYKVDGLFGTTFANYNTYKILNDETLHKNVTVEEGLKYIFRKLIINRHSRVALDKLRVERINTFKFEIRGTQIYYINDVVPAVTNPRLNVALTFLSDLGLYSMSKFELTSLGRTYL